MFGRKSDWLCVAITVTVATAVLFNLLLGSKAVLAQMSDIYPECNAGGETPNYPPLACTIVPVYENNKLVGEDCVGQTTPTAQACSGWITKIVKTGDCVSGTNPPEIECQLYSKTIQQDQMLAQCEEQVDGDGKITNCDCKLYDVGAKATTTYTECREVATV